MGQDQIGEQESEDNIDEDDFPSEIRGRGRAYQFDRHVRKEKFDGMD